MVLVDLSAWGLRLKAAGYQCSAHTWGSLHPCSEPLWLARATTQITPGTSTHPYLLWVSLAAQERSVWIYMWVNWWQGSAATSWQFLAWLPWRSDCPHCSSYNCLTKNTFGMRCQVGILAFLWRRKSVNRLPSVSYNLVLLTKAFSARTNFSREPRSWSKLGEKMYISQYFWPGLLVTKHAGIWKLAGFMNAHYLHELQWEQWQ